jgi:cytochrome c553
MLNKHRPTIFGALVLLAALAAPATAQDIEGKLQACNACHGQNGQPISPLIPVIWGQQEYFLVKQLHDYQTGERDNQLMSSFAKALTPAELRPAAAALSKKAWPARTTPAASAPAPAGMAVCQICHQQNFVGGLPAPRLAGQSYEYLKQAMDSFANGTRTNNADMVKLMEALSPAEREAMARYISSL